MDYKEQLKNQLWLNKKAGILKRDNYRCANCGNIVNLQVHHIRYKKRHYAWEYKVKDMQVLCVRCHQMVHGLNTELDKQLDLTLKLN
jgi:5-methylcytosine-specific restriction endonuclease McrA